MLPQENSMLVFLAIIAVAFSLQGLAFLILALRISQSSRSLEKQLQTVLGGSERTLELVSDLLRQARPVLKAIEQMADSVRELSFFAAEYAQETGAKVTELTEAARAKVGQAEGELDRAFLRYEEASEAVHQAVLRPTVEVSAVAKGVRTAFRHLFRRGPRPVSSYD